jgi:cysteine-rich repeat protein
MRKSFLIPQRTFSRILRRGGNIIVAAATILWSLGLPLNISQAAVTFGTVEPPTGLQFYGSTRLPAGQGPRAFLSFVLSSNENDELERMVVHIHDVNSTGLQSSDFIKMNLWRDANANGTFESSDTPLANGGAGCSVAPFTTTIGPGVVRSSNILDANCSNSDLSSVIPATPTSYFVTLEASPSWGTNPQDMIAFEVFVESGLPGHPLGGIRTSAGNYPPAVPDEIMVRLPSHGGVTPLFNTCNPNGTAEGTSPMTGGDGEICDGADLRGYSCATLPGAPFTGGTLSCNANCTFNFASCTGGGAGGISACGNGVIEFSRGEQCDGANMGTPPRTCSDFGFTSGTLACNSFCGLDFSGCTGDGSECGNGVIETGEECDDDNTINGDGCNSFCQFEGTGTQCFAQDTDAACNSTPGCVWDWGQMFCTATNNPCNHWADSESCAADAGCWWDSAANAGSGFCVMKMAGGYPAGGGSDEIFSFPQPFDNDSHPLTDGDPYELDNRPPMMMIGVPRMWTQDMAPLIVGFSEQPNSTVDKITLWRYDDIDETWSNVTSNLSFSSLPSGNEIMGVTSTALDSNTIYRLSVKGVTKNSDSSLFAGQTDVCPDGSGSTCWHATFKVGDSFVPNEGYQGMNTADCTNFLSSEACEADSACNWDTDTSACVSSIQGFGCQGDDILNWRWPFPDATDVDPHVMVDIESCSEAINWSSANANFIELDSEGTETGLRVTGRIFGGGTHRQVEPVSPLSPGMHWRLAIAGLNNGAPIATQTLNFTTGNFGPPQSGGMMFGNGRLTINLISGLDGDNHPIASNAGSGGVSVVVACGNTDMEASSPQGEGGPSPATSNTFFMDGFVPAGQNTAVINGLPTPSTYTGEGDNPFENPCLVFLRPDTQSMVMGSSYYLTLPTPISYSVNSSGNKPMPPMGRYGEVTLADDNDENPNNAGPNVKTVYLEVATVVAGSLSGTVCLDDDPSGNSSTCGEDDTVLSGLDVNIFPMGPMNENDMFRMATTNSSGVYSFASLNGGQHMLQVWGNPAGQQNYNYFGEVTINGATSRDIVISLGNQLNLTLDNTADCWDTEAPMIHYNFWPGTFKFNTHPVFGEKTFSQFTDNGDDTYTVALLGFGDGTYSGVVEVPGCMPSRIPAPTPPPGAVVFGASPQALTVTLSAGTTVTGRVCADADFSGCDSPVANFNFGAHTRFDPSNPQEFGGFVGTQTNESGIFSLPGLYNGEWVFETFDMGGSGGRSFAAGQGSLASDGSYTVSGDAGGLIFYLRQDKRVNILVSDGVNTVTDAMIDINCDTGKNVHLGHSNNVWTYLPPGDTCRFSVRPRFGGRFQPIENQAHAITAGSTPQNITLTFNSHSDSLGNYAGSVFKADRTNTYPGGSLKYQARIRATSAVDLAGHSVIFSYPDEAVDTVTASPTAGSCVVGDNSTTCSIPAEYSSTSFDVYFEVTLESTYTENSLSTSLTMNSTPVTIGNVFTEVSQLTLNAPSFVPVSGTFTIFGQAYPNAAVTLSYINSSGAETVVGTTTMEPGSSWYTFNDICIGTAGEYTLKVQAVAAGSSASMTKAITVGGSTPEITAIDFQVNGASWEVSSLTGLPSGQLFEGQEFTVDVTFGGIVENVQGSFLGSLYEFSNESGNTWTVTVPAGWTGYGNASFEVRADFDGETINYDSIAEILILIDPSGYVYDTDTSNRIAGVTATVYQLVDSDNDAVTFVTGADDGTGGGTASNGQIEDGEELINNGSVLKLNNGSGIDCSSDGSSLDGCSWMLWDASTSGQLNPQTTDSEGKYGWNVPQGWYRVSFQKSGAYSLSYSRDVYVPPAETQLNLDLGGYDIAAPTIALISPASGATGVARNVQPVITFSEPMLGSTVTSSNVRLLSSGSPVTTTVTYNSSNRTATIEPSANLAAATQYTIRVTTSVTDDTSNALASTFESTFTTSATADSTAPVSTANVATGTYTSAQTVTLSATDSGVACTDCNIYYTTDGSTPTTSSTVYTSALTISSTTTLKFFARDPAGNSESPANSRTYTITITVPAVPTGLVAGGMTNSVSLNWDDVSGATGYKVYRTTTSGSGFTLVGSPSTSLYSDLSLTAGTTYYYKVSATNSAGDSALSAQVQATALAGGGGGGGGAPVASVVVTAPNGGQSLIAGDSYTVTWIASGSITNIRLSYSTDGGSNWAVISASEINDGVYSWTVPNVTTTRAKVRVEALNASTVLASDISNNTLSIAGTATEEEEEDTETAASEGSDGLHGNYVADSVLRGTPSINEDRGLSGVATENIRCVAGMSIKASLPAVYYCGNDGRRYVFPDERTYFSWYRNFNSVIAITDEQLAQIPLGGNITHRPGHRMIKIQSDPRTYVVARGGILRWVRSEAIAARLYGANWNQFIDDVDVAFFVSYRMGDDVNAADAGL